MMVSKPFINSVRLECYVYREAINNICMSTVSATCICANDVRKQVVEAFRENNVKYSQTEPKGAEYR